MEESSNKSRHEPWNKGKLVGQKTPFKLKEIWANWVRKIGLDPAAYGTHSMRSTTASLIYRRTKNLRTVQLLLGHAKIESTVRYMGIEVDDALEMAEDTECWRRLNIEPPCRFNNEPGWVANF